VKTGNVRRKKERLLIDTQEGGREMNERTRRELRRQARIKKRESHKKGGGEKVVLGESTLGADSISILIGGKKLRRELYVQMPCISKDGNLIRRGGRSLALDALPVFGAMGVGKIRFRLGELKKSAAKKEGGSDQLEVLLWPDQLVKESSEKEIKEEPKRGAVPRHPGC